MDEKEELGKIAIELLRMYYFRESERIQNLYGYLHAGREGQKELLAKFYEYRDRIIDISALTYDVATEIELEVDRKMRE